MVFKKKDFFGMRDLSAQEIRYILSTVETMKYILNQKNKKKANSKIKIRNSSPTLFNF